MNHYSQNDEQEVIVGFFGHRKEVFLDVGAYDGVTFSNTRALLERGWDGILVESAPEHVVKLIKSTESFGHSAVVIPCAAGCEDGQTIGFVPRQKGPELAAPEVPDAPLARKRRQNSLVLPVLSINRLLRQTNLPIVFLSLNADYMDFDILKAIDSTLLNNLELICIEPRDPSKRNQMKGWFDARGFVVHHETPENLLVRRR